MEERIDRKYYTGYLSGVADGLNQGRQDTIAELEKIKAEFEENKYILLNQTVAIQIIDKHISELKGENK